MTRRPFRAPDGRRHRRSTRSDAGTSAVELVITMPALLLGVLVIIQFGLWMHAQHVALAAAQDGARVARAYDGSDQAAHDRTTAALAGLGPKVLRNPTVDVVRTADQATVTVAGRATTVLGIFSLPVREQAYGPVERFVPVPGALR
jgi:Flp pilus assembly protein TadG